MIYVLWVDPRVAQAAKEGTTTQPQLLFQGDLKKKIVNLGSNLRLTFWTIAALSISGQAGSSPSQLKCKHTT
jgi:hypothetical protein